jgi:hypothetical protein
MPHEFEADALRLFPGSRASATISQSSSFVNLTGAEEGFAPPAPFDLVEMESNEVLPRTYTRAELLGHLEYCRRKCQETIVALSNEQAYRLCRFSWGELPFAELQLYNLRHVQEHGAQLHMFLGQ